MKFIRYIENNINKYGILVSDDKKIIELNIFNNYIKFNSMIEIIEKLDNNIINNIKDRINNDKFIEQYSIDVTNVEICSPIKRPIHDIICVGVNYQKHFEESSNKMNVNYKETVYFSKRCCEIIGTNNTIKINFDLDKNIDYEVELAVIIGKKGKNIPLEKVNDYIFGYSVFNDLSARTLQKNHNQWFRGKSLDNFSIMGPCILHKSSINTPINVKIKSYVNNEIRQNSNTSCLLKNIPTLINEISKEITLEPGDIIITGTPEGVGMGFNPPKYLKKDDVIKCYIENIGEIVNTIQ